jgi:purine nucleosidase
MVRVDSPCPPYTPAVQALARALHERPLTVLALGQLTNVATLLQARPDLIARLTALVAVMGHRPGHRFHPSTVAKDAPSGATPMLPGHGPPCRERNLVLDRNAARTVLSAEVPRTLVPYNTARQVLFRPRNLERLRARGGAAAWVAQESAAWLHFWQTDVGVDGFVPLDLVAAALLLVPARFDCPQALAWLGRDPLPGLLDRAPALLVTQEPPPATAEAQTLARYCTRTNMRVRELFE